MSAYRFDLAISYAHPEREYASAIARAVSAEGISVFFDEFFVAELWGKNLAESLGDIYAAQSRYCLVIISEEYRRRTYTNVERRAVLDRAIRERGEYILPVVTDDAWLEGVPRATAFLDLREQSPDEIASIVVEKIRGTPSVAAQAPPASTRQKVELLPRTARSAIDAHGQKERTSHEEVVAFADIAISRRAGGPCGWGEGRAIGHAEAISRHLESAGAGACEYEFRGGQFPADPVFDVTIVNRDESNRVVTAVGVEILSADHDQVGFGGTRETYEIEMSRILVLELPDIWKLLVDSRRQDPPQRHEPLSCSQRTSCRLPNPVLLRPGAAYRFGLYLLNYWLWMPNIAIARVFLRSEVGTHVSARMLLSYTIPGYYFGAVRYDVMMRTGSDSDESAVELRSQHAFLLWDRAGRPSPGPPNWPGSSLEQQFLRKTLGL